MNKFDPTKEYTLRKGIPYRNYCVDGGGNHPIHGAWFDKKSNEWVPITHSINLKFCYNVGEQHPFDLVEKSNWFDNIPATGILCWVWDSSDDKKSLLRVGYKDDNYFISINGTYFLNAEPATLDSIRHLLWLENE